MMIITDSASDITKQEALEMNIRIVSLKIRFSDGEFHQNMKEVLVITLSSGLSGQSMRRIWQNRWRSMKKSGLWIQSRQSSLSVFLLSVR